MARKLAFDYDTALDKAMHAFWEKGYTGTSLRDLLKAIGIGEGSFYNTLKGKRQLYLACLKRYQDTVGRRRAEALFTPSSAKMGIRGLFRAVLDDLYTPGNPRACLLARSVSSDVLAEPTLQEFIRIEIEAFLGAVMDRLKSAKDVGDLPPEFDAQCAAEVIATYLQGLFRAALLVHDRSQLERQIDLFLSGMGL
jgi:TetR/AcrR family transcriptional repressor of nem operon